MTATRSHADYTCSLIPVRTRRDELLDAAIELLGGNGVRAVTHRAVDAEAGLPAGSASNVFRSRDALFDGIVERVAARERANWDGLAMGVVPGSPTELARVMAEVAVDATHTNRTLTLCRYSMLVESARRPELRHQLMETGARINTWVTAWLRATGSSYPERDMHLLANYYTGLVLHELAIPDPAFDPFPRLDALLTALIGASA
jgi:DNA-binding transcriptional regulator YbjK